MLSNFPRLVSFIVVRYSSYMFAFLKTQFKNKSAPCWAAVFCVIGIIVGVGIGYYSRQPVEILTAHSIREHSTQYQFIKPLLALDRPDGLALTEHQSLYTSVSNYIQNQKAQGSLQSASVYFIDYGGSGSFNINEKEQYSPASMLKVVIMLAFFKQSESVPGLFDQQFTYEPEIRKLLDTVPFESPTTLVVGQSYSVSDLINKMIINSDNGAKDLLLSHMTDVYLSNIYTTFGLNGPGINSTYTISAKDYSLFFRVLYNATYLTDTDSEKALSILSHATYADGLVAGLPKNTIVAHKFGEYVNGTDDQINSVELHDCGIVYPSRHPYLLCIMTRGKDLKTLSTTISTISKMVYSDLIK